MSGGKPLLCLELVKRGSIHTDVFFKVEHILLALPGISRLHRHNIDHVTLRTARTDLSICLRHVAAFLPRLAFDSTAGITFLQQSLVVMHLVGFHLGTRRPTSFHVWHACIK